MVTLKDIAKRAGVSISLVSNYLNRRACARMSEETRKKIDAAVAELNYRGSVIARSLRTGKSNIIGYIVLNTRTEIFQREMLAILDAAAARNYKLFTDFSIDGNDTLDQIDALAAHGCDAFVISGVFGEDIVAKICEKNYPIVILNSHSSASAPGKLLRYDYRSAIRECIEYLQSKGHSEIFYFNDPRMVKDQRYLEFRSWFGDEKVWNVMTPTFEDWSKFRKEHPECTAIMHINDIRAMKTIQFCHQEGIRVPEDIAVTGFDDIRAAACTSPSLTTISKPLQDAANLAVQALVDQMEEREYTLPESLPCQFILRDSN